MDRRPCQPGDKPAHPDRPGLQDGETLADYRHVSLVEVAERMPCGFPRDASVNQLSRITSLLHRNLSDARQRLSVLLEGSSITNHKNLPMPRHATIRLHLDPARAIGFYRQPI